MSGIKLPMLEKKERGHSVNLHCEDLLSNALGHPFAWLMLLQLIASIALIRISDWYRKSPIARKEASLLELEALFALRDLRDGPVRRHPR
jgi:hypothetical protein